MTLKEQLRTDLEQQIRLYYGWSIEELETWVSQEFEFTGEFRRANGEHWLEKYGAVRHGTTGLSVLILRKKKPRRWVYESTGEFRIPQQGEWVRSKEGTIWRSNFEIVSPPEVLRLLEAPEDE